MIGIGEILHVYLIIANKKNLQQYPDARILNIPIGHLRRSS